MAKSGYKAGRIWTEEWRANHKAGCGTAKNREVHRKLLLERLPTMTGPATNSPIERRLHDALRARGIGFDAPASLLDRYLVDISLHQSPVLIEADGAQHQLPVQRRNDKLRDANLAAAGYRIFRFPGSEINRDAAACVEQVVQACGLAPDKEPTFNIQLSFKGPLHPRWVGESSAAARLAARRFR